MKIHRRNFLGALAGVAMTPLTASPLGRHTQKRATPKKRLSQARNVLFILMNGGPSHVDMFDLKEGSWTPDGLGSSLLQGYLRWPMGTLPLLSEKLDKFSLIRGMRGSEPVHVRGLFTLLTGYPRTDSNVAYTPHMASVLSHIYHQPEAILPYGLAITCSPGFLCDEAGVGILRPEHAVAMLDENDGYANLHHPWENSAKRHQLLDHTTTYGTQDPRSLFMNNHRQAQRMAQDPRLEGLTDFTNLPFYDDYWSDNYMKQFSLAVELLDRDLGTHFIQLRLEGWDHHESIYDLEVRDNIFSNSIAFDRGMNWLIDTLSSRPAKTPGLTSLLDETLVIAIGEFGRTPGSVDANAGRDHYPEVNPAMVLGGGVQGGQVFGATDDSGSFVIDGGWSQGRAIEVHDLIATIYASLGVDWRTVLTVGDRQQLALINPEAGPAAPIEELFGGA